MSVGASRRAALGPPARSDYDYEHPQGVRVTVSGRPGDDAKPYQEREVKRAIEEAQS